MTPMQAAMKLKAALIKQYGEAETTELVLWDKDKCSEMGYGGGAAALVWEGGPFDWAIEVSMSDVVVRMPGILAEPYNGYILNFYVC